MTDVGPSTNDHWTLVREDFDCIDPSNLAGRRIYLVCLARKVIGKAMRFRIKRVIRFRIRDCAYSALMSPERWNGTIHDPQTSDSLVCNCVHS
jgi:hypothetical protein